MNSMMLAVVKEKPEPGIVVKQIPIPRPEKGERRFFQTRAYGPQKD